MRLPIIQVRAARLCALAIVVSLVGSCSSEPDEDAIPTIVATVPLQAAPYGVAVSASGLIYAAQIGGSTLARGNLATKSFVSTVTVGLQPPHVVLNPAGTTAYATLQAGQGLAVVDVATNALTTVVPLASDGFNLIVAPDGQRVYATTADGTLYVVDAATNTVVTTLAVGAAANGLAFSRNGTVLYVSSRDAGTVVAIDPLANSITRTYTLGGMPQRLAVSPDGNELYVANEVSGLDLVNVASGAVTSISFGTPAYGLGLTPDGTRLYVLLPQAGEVRILDRAHGCRWRRSSPVAFRATWRLRLTAPPWSPTRKRSSLSSDEAFNTSPPHGTAPPRAARGRRGRRSRAESSSPPAPPRARGQAVPRPWPCHRWPGRHRPPAPGFRDSTRRDGLRASRCRTRDRTTPSRAPRAAAGLPGRHETGSQCGRHCPTQDEASRFDAHDVGDVVLAEWSAHVRDYLSQQVPVPENRRDVLEQDAWLGVVGDGT